jgi:hypothetical protein
MIWVTWRQFRAPALFMLAGGAAYALLLGVIGYAVRHAYNTQILGCHPVDGCVLDEAKVAFLRGYGDMVSLAEGILLLLPVVIGAFWGAPLLAREFELNCSRLAWTQSVTRRRWLAVKLLILGLTTLALTAALSLLLTWAASRYDLLTGNRFTAWSFATRNVVPVGYALFAFATGTVAGLFLRRTVAAIAVTLLAVGAVLFLVPALARPHLRAPVTVSVAFDGNVHNQSGGLSFGRNRPAQVRAYEVPGALMLSADSTLLTESGEPVYASTVKDCLDLAPTSEPAVVDQCLAGKKLHFDVVLQPGERYWSFQWIELGGYLVLTALLGGLAYWRIKHVRA